MSKKPLYMQKADDSQFSDAWLDDIGDTLKLDDTAIRDPDSGPETVSQSAPEESEKRRSSGPTQMSVEQWLASLRRTDRAFYNMMAMEVWSIAKSMDSLIPGFWSRFMENRQTAVKKFVNDRRTPEAGLRLEDLGTPDNVKGDIKGDPSQN
jgi:hypothetical protein